MKYFLMFILTFNVLLSASTNKSNEDARKTRIEKQIKKEIEKEKRHAIEQTFYQNKNYDFKGAEVNPDSLDSIPEIEVDDFDMDSVYD